MSRVETPQRASATPSLKLISALEQTLYQEARFMDEERYSAWVDMLADDPHYHMPGVETRYRKDPTEQVSDITRMAFYNNSKEELLKRLKRLETGTAWSEDPATRYTHLITNVEMELTPFGNEYKVYSNFLAYRNRNERNQDTLIGNRQDLWRQEGGAFKLVKRLILLKQNVLLNKNLNIYL